MEATPEYVFYKKVLIFGSEGSGKTSLTKRIEKGNFTNESHTETGKLKYIYIITIQKLYQIEYLLIFRKIKR